MPTESTLVSYVRDSTIGEERVDTLHSSSERRRTASTPAILHAMAVAVLTVVHDEMEADVICGMLKANAIECSHRKTNVAGAWTVGFARGGPTEVVVDERDLTAAQELLRPAE